MLKFYGYKGCDTCRKARKDLEAKGIPFLEFAIRETPPTLQELRAMLQACEGNIKKLFNTSGQDYRALQLGTKLPSMSEEEALTLLTSNGNLVKRPFLIDEANGIYQVGYSG